MEGKITLLGGDLGTGGWAYGGRGGFTVGAGGRLAFTVTRPDLPGDVAVLTPGAGQRRLLTRLNEDLLAAKTLGEVEEIRYKSSKDGREIQGWIIKPPHFDQIGRALHRRADARQGRGRRRAGAVRSDLQQDGQGRGRVRHRPRRPHRHRRRPRR
jgi:hypothetical protein